MSVEHPQLRGWFPLQDGRHINVSHIVWFHAGTRHMAENQVGVHDEAYIELMLSNGTTVMLDDPVDQDNFRTLVGTIGD